MPPNPTFTLRLFLWIRSHRILSPVTKITRRSSCCSDELACSGHRVAYWINKSQKPLWGLDGFPSSIMPPPPPPRVNTPRLMSVLKLLTRNTCIDILHEFKMYCVQTDLLPHPSCLKKPFLHPPFLASAVQMLWFILAASVWSKCLKSHSEQHLMESSF